ncbi:putative chromosome segregation SMC protein [Fimbriiglobus ruber]|uniref:Putative chromosome segregation SMC protein n=1 Tax=Fimbriiglobus ruber TaxID=1908690 RepID=A0A225DV38_9BACT|nr:putative chromosome segregation SMC protein [Fimbriiglobus ruber]
MVVVVDRVATPDVIRDIPFRCGLNIVRVADRPPGDDRIIAHSVGKTLLTRLIRYCLGEQHFTTQERTARVHDRFPTAYVLAEIRVNGTGWVVARPLRDGRAADSFAVVADDWHAGLAPASELGRFSEFTAALEDHAFAGLPSLTLPKVDRPPRWLDVLAWMSRDAECKYQHPHEWRSPLAHSGTAEMDLNDASLLTCWVMGVLDTEDITEQQKRMQWTKQRAAAEAKVAQLRRRTDALEPILTERFGVSTDELSGGLFGEQATELITGKRTELEQRRESVATATKLGELQDEMVSRTGDVRVTESEKKLAEGLLREAEADLRQLRSGSQTPDEFYASFDRSICPLKHTDCRYHPKNGTTVPDDEREARIQERQNDYIRHSERVNELTAQLLRQQQAARDATEAYAAEREARDRALRPIENEIGRWNELDEQFRYYSADQKKVEAEQRKVDRIEKQIRDSLELQRAVKTERERRVHQLSDLYAETLKRLIGPAAGGTITRDARGLHPTPDESTNPGGATLGSLAHVVALDLAYLAATVTGIGQLPGLMIHDSPESIVMESALYDRLLRHVLSLESAHGKRPVSFQHIVTTTAPPPREVAREPYEVLILDARDKSGRLLGEEF